MCRLRAWSAWSLARVWTRKESIAQEWGGEIHQRLAHVYPTANAQQRQPVLVRRQLRSRGRGPDQVRRIAEAQPERINPRPCPRRRRAPPPDMPEVADGVWVDLVWQWPHQRPTPILRQQISGFHRD